MNKLKNNMYYQTDIKTSRNEDINFLQLSYGNFVSLDDYMLLEKENKQLKGSLQTHEILLKANVEKNQQLKELLQQQKEQLKQKEEIINKAKNKLKILLDDLKINSEKEKEEGKSYFNTDLFIIRVNEIKKTLDNKGK